MLEYLNRFLALLLFTNHIIGVARASGSFDQYQYAKDDLGAVYSPRATTIKLWAPTAKAVTVALFADATNSAFSMFPMSRDADGIWAATLEGDQDGKYYLYEVTHQEAGAAKPTVYRVNDPYARGCSVNTGRRISATFL